VPDLEGQDEARRHHAHTRRAPRAPIGNAFWKTDLDAELRMRGVDMVIVSGFCAEYCVLDTYRGARERGYPVAVLRGGIASRRAEHVRLVEAICEIVSHGALAGLMGLLG
jgi:nicotinamidase-related amidase